MSVQTVIDFITKVEEDPKLADAVGEAKSENLEQLCEVARKAGFDFTVDDWKTAVTPPESRELDDDELAQVSGGVDPRTQPRKQLPRTLKPFGKTIANPNDLAKGLDWSIGRLTV